MAIQEPDQKSNIIIGAIVATAVWLSIAIVLLLSSKGCADVPINFWTDHVSCMSANEIGDFLAGAFAPLAFIWLIATVVLQGSELKAQRDELRLTREEMQESRKILGAQRLEAQRSADIMAEQLEIVKLQRREEETRSFDRDVEAHLPVLWSAISRATDIRVIRPGAEEALFISANLDLDTGLLEMARHTLAVCRACREVPRESLSLKMPTGDFGLQEVLLALSNIEKDIAECSPAVQLRISGNDLLSLYDQLREFCIKMDLEVPED